MMERGLVKRRGWLTREQFLDLMGVTNLIPGPNSTEMAMQIGYRRAGWLGLVVAGTCFILPAALITGVIAWIYVQYHDLPRGGDVARHLAGRAGHHPLRRVELGKAAIRNWQLATVGLGVAAAALAGCDQVLSLLVGTLLGAAAGVARRKTDHPGKTTLGLVGAMLAKRRRRRP